PTSSVPSRATATAGPSTLSLHDALPSLLPSVYRASGQIEIEGAQRARGNTGNSLVQGVDDSQYADQYVRSLSTAVLGDSTLARLDRKSTRLNSSHVKISYAVFCLKKQKP